MMLILSFMAPSLSLGVFLVQFCEGLMHSAHCVRVVFVDRICRKNENIGTYGCGGGLVLEKL